ncbi:MAG TPA: BlaI/MecI/CopY family transcriptional regulator [Chloroflexota bacterium]
MARSRKRPVVPALHELEAEVMEEVWRGDREISVRELMERLNRRARSPRAYTTYMTIMARLDEKGLLRRRREGKADRYSAVYGRDEYRELRAGAEVSALVSEFGDVALAHFARQMDGLDPQRQKELRRLARRAEEPTR